MNSCQAAGAIFDFLRSVERFSPLIRMYLIFSFSFRSSTLLTHLAKTLAIKPLGKIMSDGYYSSKDFKIVQA